MSAPGSPRVSVVVPVRDRQDLLVRLLDALDRQTWSDFEVIVVDDGSRDSSAAVAREARCAGRPVRLIQAGYANHGAVAARRLGVLASSAEILAFTDSDCRPDPGWLAAGVAAIDAGADVVQGATVPERPAGRFERTVSATAPNGLYPTCNVFYRHEAFDVAGGFDIDVGRRYGFRHGASLRGLGFGEDTLLAWRVARSGRAAFAPDGIVRHHVFPADRRDALRRAWAAGGFPALVRDIPELRSTLPLRRGVALGGWSRAPLYAGAIALAAHHRRLAAALVSVWAATLAQPVLRENEPVGRRLRDVATTVAVDAVTATALVAGSVRSKSIVL